MSRFSGFKKKRIPFRRKESAEIENLHRLVRELKRIQRYEEKPEYLDILINFFSLWLEKMTF